MTKNSQEVTGEIGMSPDLAMSVIKDQAGSFEHSIREGGQNGLDAPNSDRVIVELDGDGARIYNNGNGMELEDEDIRKFLTVLGETTKDRDDDSTIGQFGMGLGQILAKGAVTIRTRDNVVRFDVNNWGLEYKLQTGVDEYVDGFEVIIDFYDDEVPDEGSPRWQEVMDNLHSRFKYVEMALGKEVVLNGTTVSDGSLDGLFENKSRHVVSKETDTAWYGLKHSVDSQVSVYSNGLFVKDEEFSGLEGVIVTKGNLDLDFSRNDVKSGCEKWQAIQEEVEELQVEMFDDLPDQKLNKQSRNALASLMASDEQYRDKFSDRKVFKKANGQMATYDEITSAPEIGIAGPSDQEADELVEMGHMVLNQFDDAVKTFRWHFSATEKPPEFDIQDRADEEGIITTSDVIVPTPDNLSASRLKRMCFARLVADRIGIDRDIKWGESDTAEAWTDGRSFIALTEDAVDRNRRDVWVHQIYHILVHEWAHDSDSLETSRHGESYALEYRRKMEHNQDIFFDLAEEVSRNGVGDVLKSYGYHPRQLFDNGL